MKVTVKFMKPGTPYGFGYTAGEVGTFEVDKDKNDEMMRLGVYAPASEAEVKEFAKSNTVKETR